MFFITTRYLLPKSYLLLAQGSSSPRWSADETEQSRQTETLARPLRSFTSVYSSAALPEALEFTQRLMGKVVWKRFCGASG